MPPLFSPSHQEQARRLELLEAYDILDTPPEPEFDDIVLIASEICGTPVSLVSLIEQDRQWFKARIGFEACETPIEQSVCAYSLFEPELLIIPDLAADERTKNNTLVTGAPFIRFYAGAPLVGPDNIIIGSLCVIDTVARPNGLSEGQKKVLKALSRQVVALLEARRISHRKDELFRRQKCLSATIRAGATKTIAAQEAGGVGTFELDIPTGRMEVSAEFCRIFDLPVAPQYHASAFEKLVVAEDRAIPSSAETRANRSAIMDVEYRIRASDSSIRWISRHGSIEVDEVGNATKMRGTVQDISVQKRAALRTQALLDLGDRLRDLDTIETMSLSAADLMGKTLEVTRAGFGLVDRKAHAVIIQPDWCAPGTQSVAGPHYFENYGSIIDDVRLGRTVFISDVATDPRMAEHAERLIALKARSILIVPILDHGRFNLMAFVHHDHPHQWSESEIGFVRSFGDRVQIANARLQAEDEQRTLNREIGHRLKNTFAMVQAIATQTLRPVTEREHVATFEKRLHALSRAHDILIHEQVGATFGAIVESLGDTIGMRDRMDIEGPELMLGSRGALSLGLLLHELGTNALKYGALSHPSGRIGVQWSLDRDRDEPTLLFSWTETGGPPPQAPMRRGFGSKLIQMGLIGTGGVELSYEPPGFSATMSASLDQLQQAS